MNGRAYDRLQSHESGTFTFLGPGELGGKAAGLVSIQESLAASFPDNRFGSYIVDIPVMTVLRTGLFCDFLESNDLLTILDGEHSDGYIADKFQHAEIPPRFSGDLMSLVANTDTPLAVRSSSLLEDSLQSPFAGIYMTKMIPNNQFDPARRFRKLLEALKLVYGSVFFKGARAFAGSSCKANDREEMAVIIQQVVGSRRGNRYYPLLSGVARSVNFYPSGNASSEEGIVHLALGLGKTIVDGGKSWYYSPRHPSSPPPFRSSRDALKTTQSDFWAIRLDKPERYDPLAEVEFLDRHSFPRAEADGVLHGICSTYNPESDRFEQGASGTGPKLLDFYSLRTIDNEFNELICKILEVAEEKTGTPVEIEFALDDLPAPGREPRFGLLQVRSMAIPRITGNLNEIRAGASKTIVRSSAAIGNGMIDDLRDIIYVVPDRFKPGDTAIIASELEGINRTITELGEHYILLGFGRWGSSDPWLGIPVQWQQISGAQVIVESDFPGLYPDFSQGTHFFHNVCNLGILYMAARSEEPVDWEEIGNMKIINETAHLRHVRSPIPLRAWVDCGKGIGGVVQ